MHQIQHSPVNPVQIPFPDQPDHLMYRQRLFAKTYGGRSLKGPKLEMLVEAERIRADFLGKCTDPAVAARVAEGINKSSSWIRIGRMSPEAFEKKAKAAFGGVDCMDQMLETLRQNSEKMTKDEVEAMDIRVYEMGIAYMDFLDGY